MLRWGALAAAGAVIGSLARLTVGELLPNDPRNGFPWATLTVNLLGSAVIGGLAVRPTFMASDDWRHFIVTGVLGGFTTFSALVLEAASLVDRPLLAVAYVLATFAGGVGATALAWRATRA